MDYSSTRTGEVSREHHDGREYYTVSHTDTDGTSDYAFIKADKKGIPGGLAESKALYKERLSYASIDTEALLLIPLEGDDFDSENGIGENDSYIWLVTEYIRGENIRNIPADLLASHFSQVLHGFTTSLDHIHRRSNKLLNDISDTNMRVYIEGDIVETRFIDFEFCGYAIGTKGGPNDYVRSLIFSQHPNRGISSAELSYLVSPDNHYNAFNYLAALEQKVALIYLLSTLFHAEKYKGYIGTPEYMMQKQTYLQENVYYGEGPNTNSNEFVFMAQYLFTKIQPELEAMGLTPEDSTYIIGILDPHRSAIYNRFKVLEKYREYLNLAA